MIRPIRISLAIAVACAIANVRPAVGELYRLSGPGYKASLANGTFTYYARGSARPAMTYSLDSIKLGTETISFGKPNSVIAANDAVCLYYSDVISESYTALHKGIEQCWVINKRPRSPGSVVIQGRFHSPYDAASSLSGLSFLGERGRPVFHYSRAIAIDSLGRTINCQTNISKGKLTISISESYVKSAVFPILVDPVVGPEMPICPLFGPARGVQENIEVAAGSTNCLAVWQDARSGSGLDIFAARFTETGTVLDQTAIPVANDPAEQTDPAVAWNGQQYLVVWSDKRAGAQHIYAARVTATGEVIDKQGVLISGSEGAQAYPRVASDGSSWFVVWQDSRSASFNIYGCKIGSDGTPGPIFGITTRSDNEETPDVAWNGSNYVVVWRDCRNMVSTSTDIYGCRVAKNGIRLAGDIIVSCNSAGTGGAPGAQDSPRIRAFGSTYFVVWEDYRNDSQTSDVYGARVSSSGAVLDKQGIAISTAAGSQGFPAVGYNGSKLLVAWRDLTSKIVRGARISTSGSLIDTNGITLSQSMSGSTGIAVTAANGVFIVGWARLDPTQADGLISLVSDNGTILSSGTVVTMGLNEQKDYAVAYNGNEYVVVWSQIVSGSHDILAARVSRTGELLTPTPVNLTQTFAGNQKEP
ncbi:MAG: hypothetical protein N3B12_08855, partial [Armatimonadetes bacterium]|nr:hypothetical protein [Armatimonadota bacterium]